MTLSLIAAFDNNLVIGNKGELPWKGKLPIDMKHFKEVTKESTVVMGRKTWESIGKPLSGRKNVVLTRDKNFFADGCEVVHSVGEVLELATKKVNVFIIGGAELYKQFHPYCDYLYLTRVDEKFNGDAFFPSFSLLDYVMLDCTRNESDKKNKYASVMAKFKYSPLNKS